jgi:hypothetical protein
VGAFFYENVFEPSQVEFTSSTESGNFCPSPGGYGGPILQMSWRPSVYALDLWFSPYTVGRVPVYVLAPGSTWVDVDSVAGIRGLSGGFRAEYFFNLGTGLWLSADVHVLSDNHSELTEQGITAAKDFLDINVKAGMVYRF